MKHYDYEISRFVEDELPENEKVELEQHLSSCAQCRQTLSDYLEIKENIKQFYNDFPVKVLNQDSTKNIYSIKVGESKNRNLRNERKPFLLRKFFIPVSVAASVVIAVALVFYFNSKDVHQVKNNNSHLSVSNETPDKHINSQSKPEISDGIVKKNHNMNKRRVKHFRQFKENLSSPDSVFNITFFNEEINKTIAAREDSLLNIQYMGSLGRDAGQFDFHSIIDSTLIKLNIYNSN